MRILCAAGARPNFMKVKPVIDALESRGVEVALVHTEQHYDAAMSQVFFEELGIRPADFSLGVGSGTHAEQTARVMLAFEPVLEKVEPDGVVVVGDVNSTLACALVAAKSPAYVAHVEAGLRSRDWSMPEEINRVVTDRVSDFLLAPSPDAVDNLESEGCDQHRIHLVGNVMVDTLLSNVDRARARSVPLRFGVQSRSYGLITLHRPANVDDPVVLGRLLDAFEKVGRHLPLLFPAHPRVAARLEAMTTPSAIQVLEPLGYLDFIALEADAALVLTDSGGIQEETTVLGVPCLTLRDQTERPITVTEGTNTVVGRDPERIIATAQLVLEKGVERRRPALWDGRAGQRIADVLVGGGD